MKPKNDVDICSEKAMNHQNFKRKGSEERAQDDTIKPSKIVITSMFEERDQDMEYCTSSLPDTS